MAVDENKDLKKDVESLNAPITRAENDLEEHRRQRGDRHAERV